MEIYTIDQSTQNLFREILPEDNRSWIRTDEMITLGAVEEGKAAGVLQFYIDNGGSAIIVYLFVDPSFRRRYVGMQLLLKLFDAAQRAGADRVGTLGPDAETDPGLCRFLQKADFLPVQSDGIFMAPLSFWLDSEIVTLPEAPGLIQSFETLSKGKRMLLYREVFSEARLSDMGLSGSEIIETKLSSYFDTGEGKGCILLTCHAHHTLEVLRLGMTGKAPRVNLLRLIQKVMEQAAVHYSGDTPILIRCRKNESRKLVERLWPKAGICERFAFIRTLDTAGNGT